MANKTIINPFGAALCLCFLSFNTKVKNMRGSRVSSKSPRRRKPLLQKSLSVRSVHQPKLGISPKHRRVRSTGDGKISVSASRYKPRGREKQRPPKRTNSPLTRSQSSLEVVMQGPGSALQRGSAMLERFPVLNTLEKSTGVKKRYLAAFGLLLVVMVVFFGAGVQILADFLAIIYPVVATFKVVKEPSDEAIDDLLTYWVVWGVLSTGESFSDLLLSWLPIYYFAKFVLLVWCLLPGSQGAKFIYNYVLKPVFMRHRNKIDSTLSKTKLSMENTLDSMFYARLRASSVRIASRDGSDTPASSFSRSTSTGMSSSVSRESSAVS